MMSAVDFNPREHGEVTAFEITNVSDDRRTPLDFQALVATERKGGRGARPSSGSGSSSIK